MRFASRDQLDLSNNDIGFEGAKALAEAFAVCASLKIADFRYNRLGGEGEDVLRKAVEGRSGFELLI